MSISSRKLSRVYRALEVVALLAVFVTLRTPAEGATLAQLFDGDSITVGNARFSDWELIHLDATASPGPLLSQVFVTPIAGDWNQPGLQYSTNGHLATSGINAVDMLLRFQVTALSGGNAFVGQSLALGGIAMTGPAGLAYVSQENASPTGVDLGSTLVMADNETDVLQNVDAESFAPQFSLTVTTNIFVTGITSLDSISLTAFSQLFSQTGPQSLPGDFDQDGDIDGRDFLLWQRNPSIGDLADWQGNYGNSSLSASVAVPEPRGFWLAGLYVWLWKRR